MSRRNLIAGVAAAHLCVLAVLALMGGCALEKKEPKLMSAAPVQEVRAPEGEPESILEPKGMVEEKDLLVSREPEMVPAAPEPAEAAATPVPPTPVPFTEETVEPPAPASPQAAAEERAAAIADRVAAAAKARAAEKAPEEAKPPAAEAPAASAAQAPSGRTHKVAPGESLWKIARLYGVTVAELAKENGLAPDTRVKAGRTLVIPSGAAKSAGEEAAPAAAKAPEKAEAVPSAERPAAPASAKPLERPVIRQPQARPAEAKPSPAAKAAAPRLAPAAAPQVPPGAVRRHLVKRGETLSLIARHYRVSIKKLMAANGIKDANKVRAGMVLVIPQ